MPNDAVFCWLHRHARLLKKDKQTSLRSVSAATSTRTNSAKRWKTSRGSISFTMHGTLISNLGSEKENRRPGSTRKTKGLNDWQKGRPAPNNGAPCKTCSARAIPAWSGWSKTSFSDFARKATAETQIGAPALLVVFEHLRGVQIFRAVSRRRAFKGKCASVVTSYQTRRRKTLRPRTNRREYRRPPRSSFTTPTPICSRGIDGQAGHEPKNRNL